jgi:hypothetical protein
LLRSNIGLDGDGTNLLGSEMLPRPPTQTVDKLEVDTSGTTVSSDGYLSHGNENTRFKSDEATPRDKRDCGGSPPCQQRAKK